MNAINACIEYLHNDTNRRFVNCESLGYPDGLALIHPFAYIDQSNCFTYMDANWNYHFGYVDTTSIPIATKNPVSLQYLENICEVRNDTLSLGKLKNILHKKARFVELHEEKCLDGNVFVFSPLIKIKENEFMIWAIAQIHHHDGFGHEFKLVQENNTFNVEYMLLDALDGKGCGVPDYIKDMCSK